MDQKLIDKKIFSVYLSNDIEADCGGMLTLSGIDSRFYCGDFRSVPINITSGRWEAVANSVNLKFPDGTETNLANNYIMAFDTGSSLLSKKVSIL